MVSLRAAVLPRPDGRRRARLPRRTRCRWGRTSASTSSSCATPRERFNARYGETLVVPEARIPQVGARIMDLQDPTRKMSTTGGTEQGTVYVLDEPDAIRKKFKRALTDSGREIVRAADKPGITNLIDILAVGRAASTPEAIEREFEGLRLRRPQDGGRRRGRRLARAGARALPRSCAPTRRRSRSCSPRAPSGPARSPRRSWPTCATPWASGPARAGPSGPPPSLSRCSWPPRCIGWSWTSTSSRGRSTCCCSLILREDVDLLEVELADVVVSYLDHLEAARAARPRGRDGVPRADRGAAGAQVAADAARRGAAGARRARARRGGRGAAGADARSTRASAAPAGTWRERHDDEQGLLYRSAPLPRGAAPRAAGGGRAGLRPGGARRSRSAACCARRRRSTSATWRRRASSLSDRLAVLRGLLRRGALLLRRRGARRRPDDRRGDAVRAARALQARRGRLGAGRAVRRDHRRARRRPRAWPPRRGATPSRTVPS